MVFMKGFKVGISSMLAISLAACSSDGGGGKSAATTDRAVTTSQKDVSIRFGYWGGAERRKMMEDMIADFQKKNANIKVELEYSDLTVYYDKLATQTAGGSTPDVYAVQVDRIGTYADRNQLLPLDDLN